MQKNSADLSDAVRCWITLLEKLPSRVTEDQYFQKQLKLGITPMAACAYMLDPRYKGSELPEAFKEEGLRWLEKKNPYYVVYTLELRNPDSRMFFTPTLNPDVINKISPRNWWRTACKEGVDKGFLEFVDTIFSFPASTGGIERSFSTLGSIMSKERNRLRIEKGSKLCTIVNHYKLKNAKTS